MSDHQTISRPAAAPECRAPIRPRRRVARIVVERGSTVHAGHKGRDDVARESVRLNPRAANALGVPAIAP